MSWSAVQYSKFEDERSRPARDLVAHIPDGNVADAVDIGCGPGNSTQLLQQRFPHAVITGIDSSSDMIEAARKRLPSVRFDIADIVEWKKNASPQFDVILSNAVLQWVPDHETLFPALLARLTRGGCLAVQMPHTLEEPASRLMREIASDEPWAHKLATVAFTRVIRHNANWYYRLLRECDASVDIWQTTYLHPLAGAGAVVEWFKGSGLRPYLEPLDTTERAEFLARYEAGVAEAYPPLPDGTLLLPFPRLFFIATRSASA